MLVVEEKNSHPKFVDNTQILIENLTIWIGCILVGGTIFLGMQRFAGMDLDHLSTPFLEMTTIFFGGGIIHTKREFIRVFVIGILFGAFFFNSIFTGHLFNLYTTESDARINTFEKLSKANYTYYCDELLRYHVSAIEKAMFDKTGLVMEHSEKVQVISDLILTNKMPFAFVLLDLQISSLMMHFRRMADFTVIPHPLCNYIIINIHQSIDFIFNFIAVRTFVFHSLESNRTHIVPRKYIEQMQLSMMKHIYMNGVMLFIGYYTSYMKKATYGHQLNVIQNINHSERIDLSQLHVYLFCYFIGMSLAIVVFILETIAGRLHARNRFARFFKQI